MVIITISHNENYHSLLSAHKTQTERVFFSIKTKALLGNRVKRITYGKVLTYFRASSQRRALR